MEASIVRAGRPPHPPAGGIPAAPSAFRPTAGAAAFRSTRRRGGRNTDHVFPGQSPVERRPCARCGHPTRADRMVHGFGIECATQLGLVAAVPRLRTDPQTGPDLFDAYEEDDACDGWDR